MKWLTRIFNRVFKRGEEYNSIYLIKELYNPELQETIIVNLVCLCGWNVSPFKGGDEYSYWCEHCDRPCKEGLPTCYYCNTLASADFEATIAKYEEDEDKS